MTAREWKEKALDGFLVASARVGDRKAFELLAERWDPKRAAVALFYFEDLSIADTAIALDVPAGTVKTRLMHARRKLRNALEGDVQCVTSTE